jgi:enoyl-CoA hydratase/carnithine racemase
MSERRFVRLEVDGHVAIVSLARPEALNALSGAMADEVTQTFREVAGDDDAWVVLLRADGDKAFCVGADLKERSSFDGDDFYRNREQIKGLFAAIRATPQPVVAAIFGYALGGGFELALSADVIVAAEGTEMGLPEARVGLLPAGGGTQLLARRIGLGRAKEMIFRGRRVDAREARDAGIVAEVVDPARLDDRAFGMARDICLSSPVATRAAKHAIDHGQSRDVDEAIGGVEDEAWKIVIESEDRREGIAAFNEKREPKWRNR